MRPWIMKEKDLGLYRMSKADIPVFSPYERAGDNQGFVVHQTPEAHIQQMGDEDLFYGMLIEVMSDKPVGYVLLGGLSNAHRCIELRRLVIFKTGLGWGRKAVKLLKTYAFEHLGCHRLWLDVREHNQRAFDLYLSEGFVDEGTLRESIFWKDRFIDVKVMSILEQEFSE